MTVWGPFCLFPAKFSEMRVFLSSVWVMNRINRLNWLSWDGINRSRRRHTYYWRLSFLVVTRWRLRHCWVNTSMPLRDNPRWLVMLLSWQNVKESARWDRKSLWAECDITSSLVFEQSCTSLNEDKWVFLFLGTCCIFNHVCTQNERFSSGCWHERGACQVCLFLSSVQHAKLTNMPPLFTLVFLSFLPICILGTGMIWSLCVLKSKWRIVHIHCRSVLKCSLLKVESLNLSHDPPSD